MKCLFHHDREATGQCANCKVFLCPECINENGQNTTKLCRVCIVRVLRERRQSAKNDKLLFKIGAAIGSVIGILFAILSFIFLLGGISILEALSPSFESPLWNIVIIVLSLFLIPYSWGAQFLGLKKGFGWCLQVIRNIGVFPITILAVIFFIIFIWAIWAACCVVGAFAAPFILHNARKFLRETAWVETLPESACTYPPPPPPTYQPTPPYQSTQTTNTAANFCRHCGKPTAPNAAFCIHCGKHI